MKLTTRIILYCQQRTCCVANFIARKVLIQFSFYMRLKVRGLPCPAPPQKIETLNPQPQTAGSRCHVVRDFRALADSNLVPSDQCWGADVGGNGAAQCYTVSTGAAYQPP